MRVTPLEFVLALVVLVTVLTLDTLPAVILGVLISLGIVIYNLSFPESSELGRDPDTGAFQQLAVHEDAERIADVVVYRFEAPLIYANADRFTDFAFALLDSTDPQPRVFVLDCEMMIKMDFTGIEALEGFHADLTARGVELRLARVNAFVLDRLRKSDLLEEIGEDKIFARVELAVAQGPVA